MTDRELDALVAERVMGECLWSVFRRDGDCLRDGWPDAKGHDLRYTFQTKEQAYEFLNQRGGRDAGAVMKPQPGPYSTTGDGMLAVVERMKDIPAVDVRGGPHFPPDPEGWRLTGAYENKAWPSGERNFHVTFGATDPETQAIASGDGPTLPRAVCLAALRALGVEVKA